MPELIIVHIFDGKVFENAKAKYLSKDGLAEIKVKVGFLTWEIQRFNINPEHIIIEKKKLRSGKIIGIQHVYVDKNTYQSIPIKLPNSNPDSDNLPPEIMRDKISNLTRLAYIKAIQSPKKLDKWLTIIIMLGGYGLIRFIEWILTSLFAGI